MCLFSDYIALKYNYQFEPLTFAPGNVVKAIEVVEKSFKLYLAVQEQPENALDYFVSEFGHNLEKLRSRAEKHNTLFADDSIKAFTKPFDDRSGNLYQRLRYGSHAKIDGFHINLNLLMPIVDKIFYNSLFQLEENWKKTFVIDSTLYFLLTQSECDQSRNAEALIYAVQINNPFIEEFRQYCEQIKIERNLIMEKFQDLEANKQVNVDVSR